jgi:hypothetical protein
VSFSAAEACGRHCVWPHDQDHPPSVHIYSRLVVPTHISVEHGRLGACSSKRPASEDGPLRVHATPGNKFNAARVHVWSASKTGHDMHVQVALGEVPPTQVLLPCRRQHGCDTAGGEDHDWVLWCVYIDWPAALTLALTCASLADAPIRARDATTIMFQSVHNVKNHGPSSDPAA